MVQIRLDQIRLVTQLCPTLCDPMNHSTPGLPVHHHLPEFIQTHVHRVGDAIQPSHPLSSPFPPFPNPSQHQSLFQWGNSAWGGQSTGVSALASFLPTNTQILVTHKFLHFYSILTMIKYHRSVKTLSYDLSSMGYCFEKFSHLLVLLIVQELNYTQIFLPSSHHLLILLSI